jgi:adenylosuccinate synthase
MGVYAVALPTPGEGGSRVVATENVTVVGLQWGDEGKGKIVDALANHCQYVVRYCGGANAGHTVNVAGQRYALHLIPSGILHPGVHNVVANGVAFDPQVALGEIDDLRKRGVAVGPENLHVSAAANLVMPWHKLTDRLSEEALGSSRIGTTARGIGPCYADKAMRTTAIRVADLLDEGQLKEKVVAAVAVKNAVLGALYNAEPLDAQAVWTEYADHGRRLAGMITDTGAMLRRALEAGQRICFEGGQGSLLDIDHGTYPFVTSSSVTACGVPSGAGVPPKAVGRVLGVAKAYTSRVGSGPFPTEQNNPVGDRIRERGHEYGTTTGRPRRCGWFDALAVRYSAGLSGVDELALMLLDVLSGFDTVRLCTGYRLAGRSVTEFDPAPRALAAVECLYEDLPGWKEEITACRAFTDLPVNARRYVQRVEELVGCPVGLVSVGPSRQQTIPHRTRLQGLV